MAEFCSFEFIWRGFLFLCVLGMGYIILLWHSLSLPYNYFDALRPLYTAEVVSGLRKVSCLATLFLGKPPGVSLLVLGINSFNSNWLLSLLGSREGNFSTRECTNLRTSAYKANTIPKELPCPFKARFD